MADPFDLTPRQVVTLGGNTNQSLWSATDVSAYDVLDMELGVIAATGSITGTLSVRLITGMEVEVDDGSWLAPTTNFIDITLTAITIPYYQMLTINKGFLRYVRWSLINWNLNGLSSVTIQVRGLGRHL